LFVCFSPRYCDARHHRVLALCAELGLPTFAVHDKGTCYLEALPGQVRPYAGVNIPSGTSLRTKLALGRIANGLEVSAASLLPPLDDDGASGDLGPSAAAADAAADAALKSVAEDPRTAELDGFSLMDYVKLRTGDEEAISTLNLIVLPVFGAPAKVAFFYPFDLASLSLFLLAHRVLS
jgi:hypothetical protein